jgi:nitrite reductase/ring-hydroxylating ferredoxin subunit
MVKVGEDFYIAVRANTTLHYRKVSGSTVPVSVSINLYSTGTNKHYYALDGRGRLYAITGTSGDTVSVHNIDGTLAGTETVTGVAGLLGLADRALAKTSSSSPTNNVYEITTTGSTVSAVNRGGTLHSVVDNCTHTNTIAIDGAGTNFIRCAHSSGLYSLTYDSGSGLYSQASRTVSISAVKFATGKVLVRSGSVIKLCSTTTSSISCSDTDLTDFDTTLLRDGTTDKYLKSNGNNVFYRVGTSPPHAVKVGNIFDPPSGLPITASSPSGGNASFDLNRFAFNFKPAGAPCATQIVYLSSRTASPKYYTIAQPSNACVERILKVFP